MKEPPHPDPRQYPSIGSWLDKMKEGSRKFRQIHISLLPASWLPWVSGSALPVPPPHDGGNHELKSAFILLCPVMWFQGPTSSRQGSSTFPRPPLHRVWRMGTLRRHNFVNKSLIRNPSICLCVSPSYIISHWSYFFREPSYILC